ncbi:MAG: hypothetical protein JST28_19210 [Acidobacteria bacterium]|nr:hypothetical protein [Acidobacteriota bacterium]
MTNLELKYLRPLMGDCWVDTNVFGGDPQHLLGSWQKKDPDNVWVPYAEGLVTAILTSDKVRLDTAILQCPSELS